MNTQYGKSHFGKNKKKKEDFSGHAGKVKKKQLYNSKEKKWKTIDREISSLQERYSQIDSSSVEKFTDIPLSKRTLQGLELGKYETPTEIQKEAIGLALQGNDILGAAKTGSGKTLAFLIPVLECLNRQKWSPQDGLGALIISPTRELAYQTFVVIRKIGKFHDFSAGLVIGGKLLQDEIGRMNRTNIVICTPGRLLQHMDETANFTADSLQMLVLDEADRILDLGFAQAMNAIIENLPISRQTLLFSATQTRSVKDLARLSLQSPMYVSVHENAEHSTPTQLEQSYIVCELHDKINLLWSFIKNHLKSKTLIFLSSCKQVRYIHNFICQLRPGVSVLCLHGAMNQLKRVAAYNEFCRKQNAILLATDIAARGLDIPAVKWVLQLDCPEDANTYIHRVGRTARYDTDGESLLVLLPSEEEAMVQQLKEKKIPIEKIKVNPKKLWSIQPKLESMCAADHHVKESAQKAFLSYLRSVFMMSNKKVFNIHAIDTEKYSACLGLAFPPRIRFLQREEKRLAEKAANKTSVVKSKNKPGKSGVVDSLGDEGFSDVDSGSDSDMAVDSDEIGVSSGSDDSSESESRQSENRLEKKKVAKKAYLEKDSDTADFDVEEEDDFLTVKKKHMPSLDADDKKKAKSSEQSFEIPQRRGKKAPTKYAMAKMIQKKSIMVNQKVIFDDEGETVVDVMKQSKVDEEPDDDEGGIDINAAKQRMEKEDQFDKKLDRDRVLQIHREKRLKLKEEMRAKKNKKRFQDNDEEEEEGEAILEVEEGGADPLDFLPDPDKVYGSGDDSGDDDEEEEPDFEPVAKKRRVSSTDDSDSDEYSGDEDVASGDDDDDEEDEDEDDDDDDEEDEDEDKDDDDDTIQSGYTLQDDEALALKLLGN